MRLYCKSYLIMQIECAFPDMFLVIKRLKKYLKSHVALSKSELQQVCLYKGFESMPDVPKITLCITIDYHCWCIKYCFMKLSCIQLHVERSVGLIYSEIYQRITINNE